MSDRLARQGEQELAQEVRAFVAQLPQPRTEKELIKAAIREKYGGRDSHKLQR